MPEYFVRTGCIGCETTGLQTELWHHKIFSGLDCNSVYVGSEKVFFPLKFSPGFGPFWIFHGLNENEIYFYKQEKKSSKKSKLVCPSPY